MGATPVSALNLVAFSLAELGEELLREILRGGAAVAADAGVAILGGHSIEDSEPKYGMAVTGVVHPDEVLTNAGGRAGRRARADQAARRRSGLDGASSAGCPGPRSQEAVRVMTTLNREASLRRTRGRGARADRRDRVRAARAPARARARERRWPPRSTPAPCRRSTACSSCWPTRRSARSRAARGVTASTPSSSRRFAASVPSARALARVRRDDLRAACSLRCRPSAPSRCRQRHRAARRRDARHDRVTERAATRAAPPTRARPATPLARAAARPLRRYAA